MVSQTFKKLKLPEASGVYLFKKGSVVLYIGKATSLKDRVKSYFSNDLIKTRGPFLVDMVGVASTIDWQETDSVLEAIILEAALIKKYQPKYNTKEKDDKSFNCVVITKEDFPRVLIVRQKDLLSSELKTNDYQLQTVFGPFVNGGELKLALKLVRKIFPYRDKCLPSYLFDKTSGQDEQKYQFSSTQSVGGNDFPKRLAGKPVHSDILENSRIDSGTRRNRGCFNYQLGLCPGMCAGKISKAEYAKTIRHIKLFFSGKKKILLKQLERLMRDAAKASKFELAGKYKKELFALKHINDISLIKTNDYKLSTNNFRLEAYDIAHISGTNMVGAMAVITDGEADKNSYRLFKIKSIERGQVNDIKALEEILIRRFNHPEWPFPQAVLVDGSTPQINSAKNILAKLGHKIPVLAVTKDERHRPMAVVGDEDFIKQNKAAILLANAEAHRFAIGFHRKRRERSLRF